MSEKNSLNLGKIFNQNTESVFKGEDGIDVSFLNSLHEMLFAYFWRKICKGSHFAFFAEKVAKGNAVQIFSNFPAKRLGI